MDRNESRDSYEYRGTRLAGPNLRHQSRVSLSSLTLYPRRELIQRQQRE